MSSPLLWGPGLSTNLQPGIQLTGTGSSVQSGSVNPTTTATAGLPGSLYLNSTSGLVYVKQDSGTTTNWNSLSGGTQVNAQYTGTGEATGVSLAFGYNTKVYDNLGFYNTSTGAWAPTVPGFYLIAANLYIAAGLNLVLYKNGTAYYQGTPGTSTAPSTVATVVYLNGTTDSATLYTDASGVTSGGVYLNTLNIALISGGGVPPTDVQVFTSSGTWTKPTFGTPKKVTIQLMGGGGGGGSGRKGLATVANCGGGSGSSGTITTVTMLPASLGATETVTVGTGGTGGLSVTASSTNGNSGNAGGSSTFNAFKALGGNAGGGGGSGVAGAAGTAVGTTTMMSQAGTVGVSSSATGAGGSNGTSVTVYVPATSGSGGGTTTSGVASTGGGGGAFSNAILFASNTGGGSPGAINGNGAAGSSLTLSFGAPIGLGGGGGGSSVTTNGGTGGAGGQGGAGGAGGGAAIDTIGNSGAGGAGGSGYVVVITEF